MRIFVACEISIHAPREGSDLPSITSTFSRRRYFYPRSPRGERPLICFSVRGSLVFLSTLPARGATVDVEHLAPGAVISIHAPREGSDSISQIAPRPHSRISIHAPREGSDSLSPVALRPPGISIHAPREGSDQSASGAFCSSTNFYPRSPRGERPSARLPRGRTAEFLSTLPARGATVTYNAHIRCL